MRAARLYALKFPDGRIKFGQTSDYKVRWRALCDQAGRDPSEVICSPPIEDMAWAAEKHLLARASAIFIPSNGAEWFYGNDFGAARNLVFQAHKKFATQETGWRYFNCWKPPRWPKRERLSLESMLIEKLAKGVIRIQDKSNGQECRISGRQFEKMFLEEFAPEWLTL